MDLGKRLAELEGGSQNVYHILTPEQLQEKIREAINRISQQIQRKNVHGNLLRVVNDKSRHTIYKLEKQIKDLQNRNYILEEEKEAITEAWWLEQKRAHDAEIECGKPLNSKQKYIEQRSSIEGLRQELQTSFEEKYQSKMELTEHYRRMTQIHRDLCEKIVEGVMSIGETFQIQGISDDEIRQKLEFPHKIMKMAIDEQISQLSLQIEKERAETQKYQDKMNEYVVHSLTLQGKLDDCQREIMSLEASLQHVGGRFQAMEQQCQQAISERDQAREDLREALQEMDSIRNTLRMMCHIK